MVLRHWTVCCPVWGCSQSSDLRCAEPCVNTGRCCPSRAVPSEVCVSDTSLATSALVWSLGVECLYPFFHFQAISVFWSKMNLLGAPGWCGWLGVQPLVSAGVVVSRSWNQAPHTTQGLLKFLSPFPLPHPCRLALCLTLACSLSNK